MMFSIKTNKWQFALAGAAAAGLLFLFIKAQPVNPDTHDLVVGDLNELQTKDSELGEAVLQIHYKSQHNYDGVIAIMREMQLLSARLSEHHHNRLLPNTPQIRQALSTVQQQIEQKQVALEQFKSDNATLNNAFIYIPRMVVGVFELLPRSGKAATLQREIFESLLRDALLTKVNPGNPLYYSILSQDIRRVEITLPNLPVRARVLAENAAHHAKVVLDKGASMDGLLEQLSSFGKNHIGIELEQQYLDYYHAHQRSAVGYRLGLFLAAMLLLSYAIYAFYYLREKGQQLETALYELRDFTVRLERSNLELQDFATVASHDLQEPLRKIQTFGERLLTKHAATLNEEGRDYLARMQDAAQRMRTLIDDLLTYSRVTAKAQPFTPVDLNQVVRYVLDMLEISITRSGARIEVAELITLDAEPVQMRQLLQNLISNALKFHRPGQVPRIKVYGRILNSTAALAGAQAGNVYQLMVEDQGIGFDEKYLDRIFTLFQRLHGRSEYEGSGVGLAVCRKIAEHHGGHITASSKPEAGATFIVTLPVHQSKGERSHDEI